MTTLRRFSCCLTLASNPSARPFVQTEGMSPERSAALVKYKFSRFSGKLLLSARGASAPVAAEMAKAREAPKQERQAPKARGGGGGTGAEAGVPPAMSRMDKIRADTNKKVARPAGDVDEPEFRKDAALREMAAYMKEAATKNDSKFDFLQ